MTTLLIHPSGSQKIALGIQGDTTEDVEGKHRSLFNWGATNQELVWQNPTFGYIWTTKDKLLRYLTNLLGARFEDENNFIPIGKWKKQIESAALEQMNSIPEQYFVSRANCSGLTVASFSERIRA